MSNVDIMERLRQMAGDAPVAKSKSKPADAEPKREPNVQLAPDTVITAVPDKPSSQTVPVVVLEDGQTFSGIEGCRICFVPDDAEEISDDAYKSGVAISDLYTVFRLIQSLKTLMG